MRCQTHSLGNPRALRPPALSLSLPSTLFTLLFPSASYFLSPCLRFSSCPHQFSPPSYLSTALLIWLVSATRRLYEFSLLSVLKLGRSRSQKYSAISFSHVSVPVLQNHPIDMEMFLIWGNLCSIFELKPGCTFRRYSSCPPPPPLEAALSLRLLTNPASFTRIGSCWPQQWLLTEP